MRLQDAATAPLVACSKTDIGTALRNASFKSNVHAEPCAHKRKTHAQLSQLALVKCGKYCCTNESTSGTASTQTQLTFSLLFQSWWINPCWRLQRGLHKL